MDPLIGGLITGGASLLGSMFSSSTSASNTQAQIAGQEQMQSQSEQFNAGQAQINRDYQTQMSNTAYQRASADMKAAGLNPMIMAGGGGSASTPSGSTASIGTPTVPVSQNKGALSGLGDAVSKAVSTAVDMKTFDRMTQEIANMQTQQRLTDASIRTESQRPELVAAQTDLEQQKAKIEKLGIPSAAFGAKSAQDLLSMPDWLRNAAVKGSWFGGKAEDVAAPIVNSATKLGGLELLKQAFRNKNSATSFRKGYDAGMSDPQQ